MKFWLPSLVSLLLISRGALGVLIRCSERSIDVHNDHFHFWNKHRGVDGPPIVHSTNEIALHTGQRYCLYFGRGQIVQFPAATEIDLSAIGRNPRVMVLPLTMNDILLVQSILQNIANQNSLRHQAQEIAHKLEMVGEDLKMGVATLARRL